MRNSLIVAILLGITGSVACADDVVFDLTTIDRAIAREPEYDDQPHYALLVFGPNAEHRSWLVIDGDSVAYVDSNGNGDLTDPGERVELDVEATNEINVGGSGAYRAMNVFPLGEIAGTELIFQLWIRNPDFDFSQNDSYGDRFREWNEMRWINGTLMRVAEDGFQAQNPLLLTATAEETQISHLNGPLTFELKWRDRQRLEPWPKETLFDVHIGTRNLLAKNCDHQAFAFSPLTTTEVPDDVHPVVRFEIPTALPGSQPIIKDLALNRRCCGNTFYTQFTLPQEVVADHVKATVSFPDWTGRQIQPAEFHVPINQEIARFAERTFVMFHDPEITIKDAVNVLRQRGIDVVIESKRLVILDKSKPAFGIGLTRSANVLETSARLAEGSDYAHRLSRCNARFEISFVDIDRILDDPEALLEIQSALQELTQGFVYNTWDKKHFASPP